MDFVVFLHRRLILVSAVVQQPEEVLAADLQALLLPDFEVLFLIEVDQQPLPEISLEEE